MRRRGREGAAPRRCTESTNRARCAGAGPLLHDRVGYVSLPGSGDRVATEYFASAEWGMLRALHARALRHQHAEIAASATGGAGGAGAADAGDDDEPDGGDDEEPNEDEAAEGEVLLRLIYAELERERRRVSALEAVMGSKGAVQFTGSHGE